MVKKPTNQNITLSLILPVYKQIDQIKHIFKEYQAFIQRIDVPTELIFVVNGPEDGSFEQLTLLAKKSEQIHVYRLNEGGWGRAVLLGLNKARGEYLCYTNTARTDLSNLETIIRLALVNKDVVIKATRIMRESTLRKIGSTLYNIEARLLFNIPVWDVNATPKIIPSSVFKKIKLTSVDDLIDVELITKCFHLRVPILEVPINLNNRISGKSTTSMVSALKMYMGLYRLKQYVKK